MTAHILRLSDDTLARLAGTAAGDIDTRRALGAELDAIADVLLLGDGPGGPDRTVAAGFLLALTRRVVVVPIIGSAQHPINLGRATAALSSLHGHRGGIASDDADVLGLLSRLWETWPSDSLIGDIDAGVYVDDSRILRIADPRYPTIGGPLTVPVDVTDKPVTILLTATHTLHEPGVDLALDISTLAHWAPGAVRRDARAEAGSARAVLGLAPSTSIAHGTPAFHGAGRLDQV